MKILIDAHMVGERETGNETYIVNLIRGLQRLESEFEFVVAVAHPRETSALLPPHKRFHHVPVSASPFKRLLSDLPAIARREHVDLMHVTYMAPPFPGVPFVASIHDIAYTKHPEWFSLRDRLVLRLGIGRSLHRAARIIAISNHARLEIAQTFRTPQSRIAMTHLAADSRFQAIEDPLRVRAVLERYHLAPPYLLAVGNLQPRKNLPRIIEAFSQLKQSGAFAHKLVLVGKAQWKESDVYTAIQRNELREEVQLTGYVPDDDLVALYNAADAFVYPSLYEGFGLPVIEAMACGTPVITSDCTAMPEVAGEAAVLINPYDVKALEHAMRQVLTGKEFRAALRKKGLERAKHFSWERTAQATLDIYRRAVSSAIPPGE